MTPNTKIKPSRRCYHSAIALPLDEAMLLFGGSNGQYLNDIWYFHLPTMRWRSVTPTVPVANQKKGVMSSPGSSTDLLPVPRAKHACSRVFGDHLLIHGGTTGLFRESDTWLFRVTTSVNMNDEKPIYGEWIRMDGLNAAPIARDSHTVVSTNGDRDIWLFGGSGKGTYFNDMWHSNLDRKRDTIAIVGNSPRRVTFSSKSIVSGDVFDSESDAYSSDIPSEDDRQARGFRFFEEYQRHTPPRKEKEIPKRVSQSIGTIRSRTPNAPKTSASLNHTPKQKIVHYEEEEEQVRDSMDIVEDELFSQLSEALRMEEEKRQMNRYERSPPRRKESPPRREVSPPRRKEERKIDDKTQQERDVDLLIEELSQLKQHITTSEIISPKKSFESVGSRAKVKTPSPERSADLGSILQGIDPTRKLKNRYEEYDKNHIDTSSFLEKEATERKLNRLEKLLKDQKSEQDEYKKSLEVKLLRMEEVMQRQGDAIESLSHVVNREIQSRVAGENRSQTYYQLLSQQIASQIQLQTKRFQLSVNQLSDVVSKLNERRSKQ
jgi:hypothetical protein